MPVLSAHHKAVIRRINWLAVLAAALCVAAFVLVLVDRTLWTTSVVFLGCAAVLAYLSREEH